VRLHDAASYATAVALAMFAREELGRSRILRACSAEVHAGKSLSAADVQTRCDDHVQKQAASGLSVVLTVADSNDTSGLAQALRACGQAAPGSSEWIAAKKIVDRATAAKGTRQASDRHDTRCGAIYVDLRENGTEWHRPLDITPEESYRHVNDARNDYEGERDRLVNVGLHAALTQHAPQVRVAEMHEANARRERPVELRVVGWPRSNSD
jgi:AbiV family abortive infection protein